MTRVLFVSFIDFSKPAVSGSMVRPHRMFDAFVELGCHVDLIDGAQNSYSARKKAYKKTRQLLSDNKYDLCYVELPSGPTFYLSDKLLIKMLQSNKLSIFYFYRDCYWRFPEIYNKEKEVFAKCKYKLIKMMHLVDLHIIDQYKSTIYFPTQTAAEYINTKQVKKALPPGCLIHDNTQNHSSDVPVGIYVGAVSEIYGTNLLLGVLSALNEKRTKCKLIINCPKKQWDTFCSNHDKYKNEQPTWLQVYHHSTGEELSRLYNQSHFAFLPRLKNVYHDLAFPIKLLEYTTFNKPILSTSCTETKKYIDKYNIGIITSDHLEDYLNGLKDMIQLIMGEKTEYSQLKDNLRKAALANTWLSRARKVLEDAEILS